MNVQDEITGALIGLARASGGDVNFSADTWHVIIEGLSSCAANENLSPDKMQALLDKVHLEKDKLAPNCKTCASPCGHNSDYDLQSIASASKDARDLKCFIIFCIRCMASHIYHSRKEDYDNDKMRKFFVKALFAIGENWEREELLPIIEEAQCIISSCNFVLPMNK